MGQAEKDKYEFILAAGLKPPKLDSMTLTHEVSLYLSAVDIAKQVKTLQKSVKPMDITFEEESVFPKVEVFDLSMNQGVFSQEVPEMDMQNQ